MGSQSQQERMKSDAMQCIQSGDFLKARQLLEKLCRVNKRDADAWFLLGAIYGQSGEIQQAISCSKNVLELNPEHVDAMHNLGQAYQRLSDFSNAERYFRKALELRPDSAELHGKLGYVLQEQGAIEQARKNYQEALNIKPDMAGTAYLLAALVGEAAPDKAPVEYVRGLFDNFASHFEHTLMQELRCKIPALIHQSLVRALGEQGKYTILDIGCGTGLCGEVVKPIASRLVGVDLSANMVEVARGKAIYDSLYVDDVVEFMVAESSAYDIVLAGDVFVYLGDLAPVFEACAALLSPGGTFTFSVEAFDGLDNYILRETNRYAHSKNYISDLVNRFKFNLISCEDVVLRQQKGEPVKGFIFTVDTNGR